MSAAESDQSDVCGTCTHLRLVHGDDSSWCWVRNCQCEEFLKLIGEGKP